MPTVRLRVTASDDHANQLIHALESIEGIERVEEVADLMPHMDDEDSSSAGLNAEKSPPLHKIEIEAPNAEGVRRVRSLVDRAASELDIGIEVVDRF